MQKFFKVTKIALLTVCAISLIGVSSATAQKKWFVGLGSGFTLMNAEGDQGFNIPSLGSVEFEVDMDPSDFNDFMQSAFGLGGYLTNGTWMIQGSFGFLKLGDDTDGDIPASAGGGTFEAEVFFKTTALEGTIGYAAYRSNNNNFNIYPYAGMRYTKHKVGSDLSVTQGAITVAVSEDIDSDWTDFLIGTSVGFILSPGVNWTTQFDAGFGGSEGTYTFKTSMSWNPVKKLTIGPNFKYASIEYENGEKGDSDWYFYDVDEFGAGITVLYNF